MLDRLLALVDEHVAPDRAPAVRAFTREYVRRLTEEQPDAAAEALFREALGRLRAAPRARHGADRGPRVQPRPGRARLRGRRLGPRDEHRGPAVPRGLGQRRARGPRPRHRPRRPPDRRHRARRRRRASSRVKHPREARATESVMHFELDRRAGARGAGRPRGRASARCSATSARVVRDFTRRCASASSDMVEVARAGAAALRRATRSPRPSRSCDWLARRQLRLPRRARLRDRRRRASASSRARGSACSRRPARSACAEPGGARVARRRRCASGRSRATCCIVSKTQPPVAGAPPRAHGLRRRPPRRPRRRDRRRGAHARPVHLEGVRRAREPDAAAAPQAAPILAAEDLIEGSHDYKAAIALFDSFPKDELLRRARRGSAPRGRRAARALRADQVRVLGRRDPDGRGASLIVALPEGALRRERCSTACASSSRRRFGRAPSTRTRSSARATASTIHLTVHTPEGGLPDCRSPRSQREIVELARTWDDRARDALVHRHGAERGRVLAARWAKRLPESYQGRGRPVRRGGGRRRASSACSPAAAPFHVGLRNEARRAARASGSTASAARSSSRRRRRCSSTSACA